MSISQFGSGATPNGDGQGGTKMDTKFAEMLLRYTGIGPVDWGAACMAHAVVVDGMSTQIAQAEQALAITSVQLSRHQANEDRLLAWLDEYMHDNALATNPDHDLAGAVIDVFRQQQCAIQLLREALEGEKAKTYRLRTSIAETPAPPKPTLKPGPKPITDAANDELRAAVIAHMQATARNGWAPTQREWNQDPTHNLPTHRAISMRLGSWSSLIEQAGLRMVNAGMNAGYRPATEDEPVSEPEPDAEPELVAITAAATDPTAPPVARAAKAPARQAVQQRQRTVLNARGEPETLTVRRYLLSK